MEDCGDTSDMDLVQAVSVAGGAELTIPPAWTWSQPAAHNAASTGVLFSALGSATSFTVVELGGPFGQEVKLLNKWFSAALEGSWSNDCQTPIGTDRCYVHDLRAYPDEVAFGARSSQVLVVPDVNKYTECCLNAKCSPAARDGVFVDITTTQKIMKDFLVPGRQYNATWFLRSPELRATQPGGFNGRLAKFVSEYSYPTSNVEYMGGAQANCTERDMTFPCTKRSTGCPVRLTFDTVEKGSATMYLNNGTYAPYTPFSFSFCVGNMVTFGWPSLNDPYPQCQSCAENPAQNQPWCLEDPGGNWSFRLMNSEAGSAGTCSNMCSDARTSASLYIDGLMLTAAGVRISTTMNIMSTVHEPAGSYVGPVCDSLSPNTKWLGLEWELDQNRDPDTGVARTPVKLKWRVGTTANPGAGAGWTGAGADTFHWAIPFTESITGLADSGASASATLFLGTAEAGGRYFQYEATLSTWDEFMLCPPPKRDTTYNSCLRYTMQHDGSLSPGIRRVSAVYVPDAGQFISKVISPDKLQAWNKIFYEADAGGGQVVLDILAEDMTPVLEGVASGASLRVLDPASHPRLRVRGTLRKNGVATANPKVMSFRIEYEKQRDRISIDCNSLRQSRGESCIMRMYMDETGWLEVRVHDAAGQLVRQLYRREVEGGQMYQVSWNGTDSRGARVAPGVYFVTATTPGGRQTKRIAVAR